MNIRDGMDKNAIFFPFLINNISYYMMLVNGFSASAAQKNPRAVRP